MNVTDAQREVRTVYRGGFAGQVVSGGIWWASAAAATWVSHTTGMVVLVFGGVFIFPLTMLALRLAGRPATTRPGNPFNALAIQVAFTVPLVLPIVLALASVSPRWFYPSVMIVVGAHYLPFVFLYGMAHFYVLGGAMLMVGVALAMFWPAGFATGGWIGGALLIAFGFVGWRAVIAEERRAG